MRWAYRIGSLTAVVSMYGRWWWCDLFGHGDEYRQWVFHPRDEHFRGFYMRCYRCYRFTRADD